MLLIFVWLIVVFLLILIPTVERALASPPTLDFSYPDLENLSDSEKEFLARLPAKTDPMIALKVRKIIAEQAGADIDEVWPETRLVEDLGFE